VPKDCKLIPHGKQTGEDTLNLVKCTCNVLNNLKQESRERGVFVLLQLKRLKCTK